MGTLYIGLDVHKATIAVSLAEEGRDGAVRFLGEIPNAPTDVAKLAKRLAKDGGSLEFCYEAGCCGYGIYRQLVELGHGCTVVTAEIVSSPRRPRNASTTGPIDQLGMSAVIRATSRSRRSWAVKIAST